MKGVFVFLTCLLAFHVVQSAPKPSTIYSNIAIFDTELVMYWNHDDDSITIELHAKTEGYVAVGFSPWGTMEDSDIIIGWVKDGKPILQDRYGTGHRKPSMDKKQDVDLFMGKEEDGYTVLKFKRKLITCDKEHDFVIKNGTTRMIWALGTTDPIDESSIYYHPKRGQKNVQLLGVMEKAKHLPTNALSHEFRNSDYKVPVDATTYICKVVKMPALKKKHHLVQFEPIITKDLKKIIHHILVYSCTGVTSEFEQMVGDQFQCFRPDLLWLRAKCVHMIMVWAVGAEPFFYPDHVGFSIGSPNDPQYLIMETHFDNSRKVPNLVDKSGMKIHYTQTLRKYDADILQTGKDVSKNHIIPPKYDAFKSLGQCYPKCLNEALEYAPEKELNVFAAAQHAHVLGVGVKTWLIRDGIEQPPIVEDKYYDFQYQTAVILPEERKIKPNDVIATECTYKTTGKENVTYGGISTSREMCLGFLFYWPRVNLTTCSDRTSDASIFTMNSAEYMDLIRNTVTPKNVTNATAMTVEDVVNAVDWTNSKSREKFQEIETYGVRTPVCRFTTGTGQETMYKNDTFKFTAPSKYYVEPKYDCTKDTGNGGRRKEISISTCLFAVLLLLSRTWSET